MGKSAKKTNRKLKRTIRRTVGALCLVSAITVAAIPVPENYAYDPSVDTIKTYAQLNASAPNSSKTIETLADETDLKADDLIKNLVKTPVKTYAVSQRNGILNLDWQFEVRYVDTSGTAGTDGFITKYNQQFKSDSSTLTLSDYLFADYIYVDLSSKDNVTARKKYSASVDMTTDIDVHVADQIVTVTVDNIGIEYTLTGNPLKYIGAEDEESKKNPDNYIVDDTFANKPEYKFFDAEFKGLLEGYINDYKKYATHDSSQPAAPSDISKALMDKEGYNTTKLQEQYICDRLLNGDTPTGKIMSLVPVTMMTYAGDVQSSKQIYIFHIDDGMSPVSQEYFNKMPGLLFTDSDNYLTTKFIQMIGVGENALEGVKNVTTLELGENIQYICDKAFNSSELLNKVSLPANAQIGRMAFANGKDLVDVSLGGLTKINTEAFYNTNIKTIEIPNTVTSIEDGAFANCSNLERVIFTGATNNSVTIKNGAFADCPSLVSVEFGDAKVEKIGDYAFALCDSALRVLDHLENFDYPRFISSGENLGDFTLAGRSQLRNVSLPTGISGVQTVPDCIVAQCPNLNSFYFPDNCSQTSYDPTMFSDVVNKNFYVEGPAKDGTDFSSPRKNTWAAIKDINGENSPVTYRYKDETGKYIYEINQDGLVLGINEDGILVNCQFDPNADPKPTETKPAAIVVPSHVGNTQVNGIDSGAFSGDVKKLVGKLTVEDGSGVQTIADDTFADCIHLKEVDLGDSVTSIGKNAFKGCRELRTVTIGENIKSIGDSVFANCPELVDVYFDNPGAYNMGQGNYLKKDDIGPNALTTGSPKLTVHGTIAPEYGPFAWSMDKDNFVDSKTGLRVCYNSPAPDNLTVILDNTNLLPTLVDYPHYEYLPKEIRDKVESGQTLETVDDQYAYNCTTDIYIPEGVKSIDVKSFINAKSGDPSQTGLYNGKSADTYLKNNSDFHYYDQYKNYGLFNGYYGTNSKSGDGDGDVILGIDDEYEYKPSENRAYEKDPKGNDRVVSIVMEDIEFLPDKAFDNCEKLNMVALGDDMKDVGELPFYDCTNLASVGCSNGKYFANNGILYENTPSGKTKIVEGFASRGDVVGQTSVDKDNDPDLKNVYEIVPHAFDNCDSLKFVDFEGADGISTIPEGCFANCDNLRTVDLPATVDNIEKDAFSNLGSDTEVVARNRQMFLSSGAFDTSGDGQPYFVTYKDAQSRKYAKEQGANIDKTLDDYFTVKFYSYDGRILLGTDFVQQGKTAIPPDDSQIPDRTAEGLVFDKWSIDLKNIQGDCFALAMYKPMGNVTPTPTGTPGVTPGVTPGITPGVTPGPQPVKPTPTPTKSATKYTLTVVYGSGSGQYAAGTKVIIEAIEAPAGKMFDKWVVTGASASVYSSTSKATTITTAEGDSAVTATYKDIPGTNSNSSSGSGSGSSGTYSRTGNTGSGTGAGNGGYNYGNNGTSVHITKPGISDRDKAYASVNGSSDSFVVKVSESSEAANAAATALAGRYGDMTPIKYFAMDISLYDATGNNKITDTSNLAVNVTIPIPDALRQYGGNNKVGAVINGNQLEELPCKFVTVDGVPCVSFTATHFSPYMIYVDTNNLTAGTMDGSPKTGDPIHPKWFVVIALAATSLFLFLKKDKVVIPRAV